MAPGIQTKLGQEKNSVEFRLDPSEGLTTVPAPVSRGILASVMYTPLFGLDTCFLSCTSTDSNTPRHSAVGYVFHDKPLSLHRIVEYWIVHWHSQHIDQFGPGEVKHIQPVELAN